MALLMIASSCVYVPEGDENDLGGSCFILFFHWDKPTVLLCLQSLGLLLSYKKSV